jgi:hypothetical protein
MTSVPATLRPRLVSAWSTSRCRWAASRCATTPRAVPGAYVLAGHWHPCVRVEGRALDRLRLPCFWFGEAVGVLPAFGEFTGMHPIRRTEGDRVYAVAEGQVVCLP